MILDWEVVSFLRILLTPWGRAMHICVSDQTIIGSDNGLSPSHYLNQCWNIVNLTLSNKLQWKGNRKSQIFIKENAFENIVCEMAAILSRSQCVNYKGRYSSHCMFSCPAELGRVNTLLFLDLTRAYIWSKLIGSCLYFGSILRKYMPTESFTA